MTIRVTFKLRPWSEWTADSLPRVDQALVYAGTFVPDVARFAAYMLRMGALGCFTLAAWRFGYDVKATQPFFITEGVLSHWQTYLALTGGTAMLASLCGRLAPERARRIVLQDEHAEAPVVWHARQFAQPLEQAE